MREQRDQGALIAARDSLFQNPRRITTFVKNNPYDFTSEELEIVSDWKKARLGTFFITRSLKSHSLFIESTPQYQPTGRIFAVVELGVPFKKIVQTPLPVVVHTLLVALKADFAQERETVARLTRESPTPVSTVRESTAHVDQTPRPMVPYGYWASPSGYRHGGRW